MTNPTQPSFRNLPTSRFCQALVFVYGLLIAAAGTSTRALEVKKLELVRETKETLASFGVISVGDMIVTEEALYLAVHQDTAGRGHCILVLDKTGRFIRETGRGLGRGPGELEAPQEISIWGNEIMINDLFGISYYDLKGRYIRRFCPFTLEISTVYLEDKLYIAASNPNTTSLFEAYTPEGKFLFEFGRKFKSIDESLLKERNIYAVLLPFMGKLLTDGDILYYLNSTFGMAIAFNPDGTERMSADLSSCFGNVGNNIVEENERLWVKGELGKGSFSINLLFLDAYLAGSQIYLLHRPGTMMSSYLEGKPSGPRILALDKETLQPVDEYAAPVMSTIMAVEMNDSGPLFYFFETRPEESGRILIYKEKK